MAGESTGRRRDFSQRMIALLESDAAVQELESAMARLVDQGTQAIRINRLRPGAAKKLQALGLLQGLEPLPWCAEAFAWERVSPMPDALTLALGMGLCFLQERSASEAVEALDPQPGEWILDACAAPGAKSTQILERLGGKGFLLANDPQRARLERLNALTARCGAANVSITGLDPENLGQRFAGIFDRILVDAPCSGESLFAKREDLRRDVRDSEVAGCARRQFKILGALRDCLKPGGRLVYSTCTYSREENETLIESFLEANANFRLVRQQRRWPHVDGVAGGYWALLEKDGPEKEGQAVSGEERETDWKQLFAAPDGLVRCGLRDWKGELDVYAAAMCERSVFSSEISEVSGLFDDHIVESEAMALKILHGEALAAVSGVLGVRRLLFDGFAIGAAKANRDRMNNLVPKVLR